MLKCIFCCKFDYQIGPTIVYQVPENFINKDFNEISSLLIPSKLLYNTLITFYHNDDIILGFPISIENEKYLRNSFYYTIGFILDKQANTEKFEILLKKLSMSLHTLEIDHDLLSDSSKCVHFISVFKKILDDLNEKDECNIPIYLSITINLKLFKSILEPPEIYPFQVPYKIVTIPKYIECDIDLCLEAVLTHVDGVNTIYKIAELSRIDISFVISQIKQLVYFNIIGMTDIFQFSNIYCFCQCDGFDINSCYQFLREAGLFLNNNSSILHFYTFFGSGKSVKELVKKHTILTKFLTKIRFLITYGVLKSLIKRVYEFPYLPTNKEENKLSIYCDGKHPIDEICIKMKESKSKIRKRLSDINSIIFYSTL